MTNNEIELKSYSEKAARSVVNKIKLMANCPSETAEAVISDADASHAATIAAQLYKSMFEGNVKACQIILNRLDGKQIKTIEVKTAPIEIIRVKPNAKELLDNPNVLRLDSGLSPRHYQIPVLKAFDNGIKRFCIVQTRRSGKTWLFWRIMCREAVKKKANYLYVFDSEKQLKESIWEAIDNNGVNFIDMIPKELVASIEQGDFRITLKNGSTIRLMLGSNPDSLRGSNPYGIILDEYGTLEPTTIQVLNPILEMNGGWLIATGTPRGANHFKKTYDAAMNDPEWYTHTVNALDTGLFPKERLDKLRQDSIDFYGNEAFYQQEYMCSWISPNSGSVFGELTNALINKGHFKRTPYNKDLPVYTSWDIGNCLDGDNEVLTPKGWVNIKEMPSEIAVWKDGKIWFDKVVPFSGHIDKAVHIKGAHIDIKVSPNHKMMIHDGHKEREILAENIKQVSHKIVKNGKMDETDINYDDLLNIMVQADGCLVHPNTNYFRVAVKKDKKKERCEYLLKKCGINYHKNSLRSGYTNYGFNLPKTRNWKTLDGINSNNQYNIDEIVKWDGHFVDNNSYIYNSTDESCANKVHAMATLMGYTPFIKKYEKHHSSKGTKPIYRVSFSIRPKAKYTHTKIVKMVDYNDSVYCFKTTAGWFIARDKNKNIFISGNADKTVIIFFQISKDQDIHVIDFIENSRATGGVEYYVREVAKKGYPVQQHFLPFDADYHKGARNETYVGELRKLGVKNYKVLKKVSTVTDKLNFLRTEFKRLYIDDRLDRVIECLRGMEFEWSASQQKWSDKPSHKNGYSDLVDALCYMAQASRSIDGVKPYSGATLAKKRTTGGLYGFGASRDDFNNHNSGYMF